MASEAQLQAMGLSPKESEDGTFFTSGNWTQKLALHALIRKATLDEDKPEGESLFATASEPEPQQTLTLPSAIYQSQWPKLVQ